MEEDVGEVKGPRMVAEEGYIQHVGDPEEGDVHGCGGDGNEEGVAEGGKTETAGDKRICGDEGWVIKDDEAEAEGGEVKEEGQEKGECGGDSKPGWSKAMKDGDGSRSGGTQV